MSTLWLALEKGKSLRRVYGVIVVGLENGVGRSVLKEVADKALDHEEFADLAGQENHLGMVQMNIFTAITYSLGLGSNPLVVINVVDCALDGYPYPYGPVSKEEMDIETATLGCQIKEDSDAK